MTLDVLFLVNVVKLEVHAVGINASGDKSTPLEGGVIANTVDQALFIKPKTKLAIVIVVCVF